MSVYGAMSALGITAGVLLGGLGAAAGIAAMTAISTSVSDARIPHAGSTLQQAGTNLASVASDPEALAACYATAFLAGSALLLAAAVFVGCAMNTRVVQKAAGAAAF